MPKLNSNAGDKQVDPMTSTAAIMANVSLTTDPVVITAVQRKANIGNYETVDVYMAVAIPQAQLDLTNKEALAKALNEAADYGFGIVSRATGERYMAIKQSTEKART